jgi:hypothetical protein
MTAAALLVVLGAALLMQLGGLSMAMGAFLAGVLLSESTFRHQLEADVEPFRGILLGLFFLSVGMSLDLAVVAGMAAILLGGRRMVAKRPSPTRWRLTEANPRGHDPHCLWRGGDSLPCSTPGRASASSRPMNAC